MMELITISFLILIFFALIFFVLIANRLSFSKQCKISVSFFILFTVIASLRWKTGSDWEPYHQYYQECLGGTCPIYFEPGYWLINQITSFFGLEYSFVLLICAFLCNVLYYFFIKKFQIPLQGLLALYVYGLGNLIIIRATIAQSFALYALTYPFIGFSLFILIASTFHYSALFAFVYSISRNLKIYYILFLSLFLLVILNNLDFLVKYIPFINSNEFTISKLDTYYYDDSYLYKGISLQVIFHRIVIFLLCFKYRNLVNKKFPGLFNLVILYILLGLYFSYSSPILLRFVGYLEPFVYIYLAIILSLSLHKLKNYYLALICISLLGVKFFIVIYSIYDLIIPYEFIFQNEFKDVY